MTVDFDRPEVLIFLTKRQFEACVEQHQVQGGVFGAADLIISHDDLRVQREPLPRTLLGSEQQFSTQTHQANPKKDHFNVHRMKSSLWCCWWDGDGWQTSFDWRMLCRGIHTVPTMVSQINPLFHTSTVRPKSRRLISLRGRRKRKMSMDHRREEGNRFTFHHVFVSTCLTACMWHSDTITFAVSTLSLFTW